MIERSLVLVKPDAVARGIIGEILHRFERAGLKMVGAKMLHVDMDFGAKHYHHSDDWKIKVGERNIEECKAFGFTPKECFGTEDPKEIGNQVDVRSAEFLSSGPVFAMVLQGPGAVKKIRSLVGSLFPNASAPGTIRGDFGIDTPYSSMKNKRVTFNIIHASGEVEEAVEEIKLWFKPEELLEYRRVHEDLYSY